MPSVWAAGLLLRRIHSEWGTIILLFVLVAGTAFVFAGAPRVLNRVYDDALRHELREASPAKRNLTVALADSMDPGSAGGVAVPHKYGQDLEAGFPPGLRSVIDCGSQPPASTFPTRRASTRT
jgi:hypothetical protein